MERILAVILAAAMMLCVNAAAFADGQLSLEQAKRIALDCAGVNQAEATFMKACRTWEDGRQVYEIEFRAGGAAYEMDVDALTGRAADFDIEYRGGRVSRPLPHPGFGCRDEDPDDLYDYDWDDIFDLD